MEKQENNIYHQLEIQKRNIKQMSLQHRSFLPRDKEYLAVLNKVAEESMVDTSKIAEYFNVSIEAA